MYAIRVCGINASVLCSRACPIKCTCAPSQPDMCALSTAHSRPLGDHWGTVAGSGSRMVGVTNSGLEALTESPPALDIAAVAKIAAEGWGLDGELTPLHGERDLNFRLSTGSGDRYVLKIQNPVDTVGVLDLQTAGVRHILQVAPDLPVPDVVLTRSGEDWATTTDRLGRRCHVRLLTHLDGHHVGREALDEADLYVWGRTVASLGRALRGFFHPEAGYPIAWDIKRLPAVRDWAAALDGEQRLVVLDVVATHEERVAPVLAALRAQVIHNDLSRGNVLVDDRHAISGITDFGDMTHTALVCDLAVAIADVLDGREDSLRLAEPMIAGYVSVTPLERAEANLLADLVAGRCAAGLAIQAWQQRSQASATMDLTGGNWQLLSQLLAEGLDRVRTRFAAAAEPSAAYPRRSSVDLQNARVRSLGPLSLSYDRPVHLVAGDGVELYGVDGRTYIDAYNNVPVLGHSHPAVAAAVAAQMRLLNTNSRYLHEAPVELAERLLATMPDGRLNRVLFVNSGSEANDLAWRIACFATGRAGGAVTSFAYHGVTAATSALSPEGWPRSYHPHHIRLVDPPTPVSGGGTHTVATAAGELDSAGIGLAALFVDGVFTSDGILGPAEDWTKDALAAVRAAGGLYVADEVQAGYGRTGDHLWSFAASDLDVDLVTLGKPMGNGFPIAAVVSSADLVDPFMEAADYFSTFGGGTVACAAGLAVLRTVEQEGLVANARAVGGHLTRLLTELSSRDATLAAPRSWGLAVGVDIRSDDSGGPAVDVARRLVDRMRQRGVLIGLTGPGQSTLKIRPPLVFSAGHSERLVTELEASLSEVRG
jgi:4-aminobutyrate aminotransferase-like enzyme/Ser/Thr protein kinase RdoA (MazF antagonist)